MCWGWTWALESRNGLWHLDLELVRRCHSGGLQHKQPSGRQVGQVGRYWELGSYSQKEKFFLWTNSPRRWIEKFPERKNAIVKKCIFPLWQFVLENFHIIYYIHTICLNCKIYYKKISQDIIDTFVFVSHSQRQKCMYLSKWQNKFVKISKCICLNWQIYLTKLQKDRTATQFLLYPILFRRDKTIYVVSCSVIWSEILSHS